MPAWVGHFNVTMWLSEPDNHRPHEGFGRTMDRVGGRRCPSSNSSCPL